MGVQPLRCLDGSHDGRVGVGELRIERLDELDGGLVEVLEHARQGGDRPLARLEADALAAPGPIGDLRARSPRPAAPRSGCPGRAGRASGGLARGASGLRFRKSKVTGGSPAPRRRMDVPNPSASAAPEAQYLPPRPVRPRDGSGRDVLPETRHDAPPARPRSSVPRRRRVRGPASRKPRSASLACVAARRCSASASSLRRRA